MLEGKRLGRFSSWYAGVAIALFVVGVGTAGAKPKAAEDEHVLLTFSGTGQGTYNWSVPEDDVGEEAGACLEPSNSYTDIDKYSFRWSEKFTFPEGAGGYVLPHNYKVTGTDQTTQVQGNCTNGFGSPVGGDSYSCSQPFGPFESSSTDYPTMSVDGSPSRIYAITRGGVQQSGVPSGTNCVGAALGGASGGFELSLEGKLKFSVAELERKGSLSKAVQGKKSAGCSSQTCEYVLCKDRGSSPEDVPTTCSTSQSYSGELKIKLLK